MSQAPPDERIRALRQELDGVDLELVELAARRQQLVAEIGCIKHSSGRQLRDFQREREVFERVRSRAKELELDPALADALFRQLVEASLIRQERDRMRLTARGRGQYALIIGGAGRMGVWLGSFFNMLGFDVELADPAFAGKADGAGHADWRTASLQADIIALAAPIDQCSKLVDELAECRPSGLIFDIASLKSPLAAALRQAASQGLKICSVHPMFGPSTRLLSDQRVLVMDAGCASAVEQAAALFAGTLARVVMLDLDDHDRLMAPVLGLSHALNIVFFMTLASQEADVRKLADVAGTTFRRQLSLAAETASESAALYFDIQSMNPHGAMLRQRLAESVSALLAVVDAEDRAGFESIMSAGRMI